MLRISTEVMKSIDCTHTEANEVNGYIHPTSLLENGLTQGMKQLQLSSNGYFSSLPPRYVLASYSVIHFVNNLLALYLVIDFLFVVSRNKGVSLRNVTMELAVEKDALAALYGRDGAGLDNLQQVFLLYLNHFYMLDKNHFVNLLLRTNRFQEPEWMSRILLQELKRRSYSRGILSKPRQPCLCSFQSLLIRDHSSATVAFYSSAFVLEMSCFFLIFW